MSRRGPRGNYENHTDSDLASWATSGSRTGITYGLNVATADKDSVRRWHEGLTGQLSAIMSRIQVSISSMCFSIRLATDVYC